MTLKTGYGEQLKRARSELGIDYVRFHGIFDDDVGVWIGTHGQYNFTKVRAIYDVVRAAGMKPYVELSFMPAALAQSTRTVFAYNAHTAPPMDWEGWATMVEAFTKFLIDSYGIDEVKTWPFEVWNEPNCGFYTPPDAIPSMRAEDCCAGCGMMGGLNGYMTMYRVTSAAVKRASGDIQVGGPSSAQLGLINDFLRRAEADGLPVDFVSTHLYPTDPVVLQEPTGFAAVLDGMVRLVHSYRPGLPVYLSEYNSGLFADWNHDSEYAASFIVAQAADLIAHGVQLDIWSYWTFSDIFEEQGWIPQEFHNGFGLISLSGVAKPGYRALQLLALPSVKDQTLTAHVTNEECTHHERRLSIAPPGNRTLFTIARPFGGGRPGGLLYIANFDIRDAGLTTLDLEVNIGSGKASVYRIDAEHSNPQATWAKQGSPVPPSADQLAALHAASEMTATSMAGPTLSLQIPAYGVIAIEVDMDKAPLPTFV